MLAVLLVLLGAFPWAALRGPIERHLSRQLDAQVTIGALSREGLFSLRPTIAARDVHVAQPARAGAGDLATARALHFRFSPLSLLIGRLEVDDLVAEGLALHLKRDGQGRWNVGSGEKRKPSGSGRPLPLDGLVVRDGRLLLQDDKRHMIVEAGWSADAQGIHLAGDGRHRGRPMHLVVEAGPVAAGRPWDLRVALASPLLTFRAEGRSKAPLSLAALSATVEAKATDAHYLDDVIEAGLPGTQPVTLAAHVQHDRRDWHVTAIKARVGRSPFAGRLDVLKRDDRTILNGDLDFAALDFDDLASDAGRAGAAAQRKAIGPRVIPDTQIHFEKLSNTDGTIHLTIRRLLPEGPGLFRDVETTMTMDHRLLTLAPLRVGLRHGSARGRIAVDHRGPDPLLSIDLTLAGARLEDITGNHNVEAPLGGRFVLAGRGRTIRDALGRGSGHIGLAGTDGSIDRKLAIIASGDVLRSIGQLAGKDDDGRAPLRCVIVRFDASGGRIAARNLLLDTDISRADGSGAITLPAETIDLAFTGRAKNPGAVQVTAPVRVVGTMSDPKLEVIPQSIRKKGLFAKAGAILGGLSTGGDRPVAPPIDCRRMTAEALR